MSSFRLYTFLLLSTALCGQSNTSPPTKASIASALGRHSFQTVATSRRAAVPGSPALNFAPVVTYGSGGTYALSAAIADVNGDGKPDVLVANEYVIDSDNGGSVSVLLGNGDGTFQTAVSYNSGGYGAYSLAAQDVNGDGKLDLLVSNFCLSITDCTNGSVGVLLGNGDGTFQTAVTYGSGGAETYALAVADVNRDGRPDLLVASICFNNAGTCATNGAVGVLMGNGDGTFQTAVTYDSGGAGAVSVAAADVNGDGKPDVVVTNYCDKYPTCGSGLVGVLLGNGDGTFQTAMTYNSGASNARSGTVADVNGDGKLDLLTANFCASSTDCIHGVVGVLLGNGDGTFQTAVTYGSPGAYSVAVSDVNGDRNLDLVVANGCNGCGSVGVLLGNGDGTFQTAVSYNSGGWNDYFVAAADVNGDGKPDLVVTNSCTSFPTCGSGGVLGVLINMTATPTTTTLVSSPNPSNFGQGVTFTASVTAQLGFSKGPPTGAVNFFDGAVNIGSSNLNSSGISTFTDSALTVGTHSITATYGGDFNFVGSTSVPLNQLVQGAIVGISPNSLNFGNQTVGISSTVQTVTLTNSGNIALILTVSITGANSGDFSQTNNCGSSVAAGGSCLVNVAFTPITTGTRTASLTFTDNAPSSPQSVSLNGVGVTPTVQLSPTSVTFPTQIVFTTSKAQTVKLTNTGLGILVIKGGGVSGPFGVTTTCGGTVNPGASCAINVTFKPKTIGPLAGSISVKDNAPGSPQNVALSGTGTYIQLTPTSVNFGNQPVGTKSLPKRITLSNKGGIAVSITGVTITGTNSGDFNETLNNCGTIIAAGASCFIGVTFTPSASGARSAAVSISDNGGGSPQAVPLAGTGT